MKDLNETIKFLENLAKEKEKPKLARDSNGKIKVLQLKRGTKANVTHLVKNNIDFNLETKEGFIMFVGGILSKLVREGKDYKQYFYQIGRGWIEC